MKKFSVLVIALFVGTSFADEIALECESPDKQYDQSTYYFKTDMQRTSEKKLRAATKWNPIFLIINRDAKTVEMSDEWRTRIGFKETTSEYRWSGKFIQSQLGKIESSEEIPASDFFEINKMRNGAYNRHSEYEIDRKSLVLKKTSYTVSQMTPDSVYYSVSESNAFWTCKITTLKEIRERQKKSIEKIIKSEKEREELNKI